MYKASFSLWYYFRLLYADDPLVLTRDDKFPPQPGGGFNGGAVYPSDG